MGPTIKDYGTEGRGDWPKSIYDNRVCMDSAMNSDKGGGVNDSNIVGRSIWMAPMGMSREPRALSTNSKKATQCA